MRRLLAFIILVTAIIYSYESVAGVRMITDSKSNSVASKLGGGYNYDKSSRTDCIKTGYKKTSCSGGLKPTSRCPFNSMYFKECCNPEYRYTHKFCTSRGMVPSMDSCGGLYACE